MEEVKDKVEEQIETVTEDNAPEETEDTIVLGDDGEEFTIISTVTKKGKKAGRLALFLKPVPTMPEFFAQLRSVVGEENWDKCVMAMVRTACNDATLEALGQAVDGKISESVFGKALIDWFTPATRRSGPHIKDLREKAQEIFSQLNPLLLRHFQHKEGEEGALNETEYNSMLQLTMEYSDINQKIEERSRKGKKAAK